MEDGVEVDPAEAGRWQQMRDRWSSRLLPKIGRATEGAEARYLGLLRVSSLILATILLIGASIFILMGAVKQIGSSDIEPELAKVAIGDLIPAEEPQGARATQSKPKSPDGKPPPLWAQRFTSAQQQRLYGIYKDKFEPSRRADEQPLARERFFEQAFPDERLEALDLLPVARIAGANGKPLTGFAQLADALAVALDEAAATPAVKRQLSAYKSASKVEVCETKIVSRSRQIRVWDSQSMGCAYWYEYPYGCSVTRTINEPVSTRSCAMRLPGALKRPVALYGELVGRYAETAMAGVEREAVVAAEKRAETLARKAEGKGALVSGGQWFLAFMAVMFLYLIVAMERHQRRLAARIEDRLARSGEIDDVV
ncbi:MAG TPA: hypothetical protein PKD99_07280 [Sphingopyxis sp.]|nr:hypothetical protein [Sphingopyxis sp.]HMP44892.1 hypothetical protein [Sphingopyxis sp.]HMQ19515.1 hypothetical protein [Sphingopyxis sp.]